MKFFILILFSFLTVSIASADDSCGKKSCKCEHEADILNSSGQPVDTEYSCRIARCEQPRDEAGNKRFCYYCKVKVGNRTIFNESIPANLGAKIGSGGDSLGLASSRVIRGYFSRFHDSFKEAVFQSRVPGYALKPASQNYFQNQADERRERIREATTPKNEEQRLRFCSLGIIADPSMCDTEDSSAPTEEVDESDDSDSSDESEE